MEEKRIQEEDRLKLQKQDNWAERALNQMMGGRLEDRSDQEEKEELVRPEWMNKPKEEMSEEERKLVKEFEKKLATFKEEQEKYKKALETELRKLQSSIVEVCENFDKSLNEFFNSKLETDQLIFQTELKLIKLNLSSVFSENDEAREEEILTRLEQLKNEKTSYVTEIPEIKKDLERCREEYEQVMKKDKEMDKIFKKEFHNYDFYFDNLMKLFKKRETQATLNLESDDSIQDHNKLVIINPFSQIEKSSVWEDPLPLNIEVDLPEGISMELWQKLVELRDRKIALEKEVFIAFNRFQEMQTLVQAVLDESERIKQETDVLTSDLNQFLEYKFHSTYNVENLFQLKQGQVEISQEPVVTDYSDAVLIHRGQVERLNESIAGLGKSKVDALKEMKEYRKGIHALEWENKMLDFQADDAIIRTRDIQLLRLTKQMQEYLRSGDEYAQTTEIIALEKRAEYSQKAHLHKLEEKNRSLHKLKKKILEKSTQNEDLDKELEGLEKTVKERNEIFQSSSKHNQAAKSDNNKLNEIYTRRRLVDLAKGQAQDIAILREEVERLRLRTYPAFSASKRRAF
ncbi:Cilia- and flagella-associated protein 43 [Clydaea vesicula]|uniref:Cilia- and flagella-associated protein 43 n=1 Tax=Clydaea vesicula TaxID=447962 RepID=A0AAD5XZ80_9FUNG|nr:Cilia- and flagella-associated protein 43 [Clydaea vesicula]